MNKMKFSWQYAACVSHFFSNTQRSDLGIVSYGASDRTVPT